MVARMRGLTAHRTQLIDMKTDNCVTNKRTRECVRFGSPNQTYRMKIRLVITNWTAALHLRTTVALETFVLIKFIKFSFFY